MSNQFFKLTMRILHSIFFFNLGRNLHHRDIIVINQKAAKRNLQSVNHVLVLVLDRVQNHVLGRIGMITNGKDGYHHQKPGSDVIQKIRFNCILYFLNPTAFSLFQIMNKLNKLH